MKKLVVRFVLFGLLFLGMVKGVGMFDNADKQTNANLNVVKLQQLPKFDSLDILFVGNSYCYSGIDPAHFDSIGLSTYNLGVATAGPHFYELIVSDYLEVSDKAPKVALLLVSPMTFSRKADNWSSYPIHRYLNNPLSNEALAVKFGEAHSYLPLLVSSFSKGVQNLAREVLDRKGPRPDRVLQAKGYSESYVVTNQEIEAASEHLYLSFRNDRFDAEGARALQELAAALEKAGSEVVFFELPANQLESYFHSEYLQEYRNTLVELEEDYTVLEIEVPVEEHHFRNLDHLNAYGADLVSRQLIEDLKEEEIIPLETDQ